MNEPSGLLRTKHTPAVSRIIYGHLLPVRAVFENNSHFNKTADKGFRVTTMKGTAALRLDQLPSHQWATVLDVLRPAKEADCDLVLRLSEIGFVPGQAVCIVASGVPGREPLAVRLGHTTFALRRHEAALVHVAPGGPGHG